MSDLKTSIARFSVVPNGSALDALRITDVVVVAPGTAVVEGFARAQLLAEAGRTVRLIGDAVTFTDNWPDWVKGSAALVLTEAGAYRVGDLKASTDAARQGIEEWLDEVFAGALPDIPGNIFYGSAILRLFRRQIDFAPTLHNIVAYDGARQYHYVGSNWIALEALRARAEAAGGTLDTTPRASHPAWGFKIAALALATLLAAMLDHLRRYLVEAPARRKLKQLRSRRVPDPALWVGLAADWARAHRHILESVVEPALARGERPGILLLGKLQPGMRLESNMRVHVGKELWPGLGPVREVLDECAVDQVTSAESLPQLAGVFWRGAVASLRAIARVAGKPPYLDSSGLHADLSLRAGELAKLLTHDLVTATLARSAASDAIGRHDFVRTTIVFPGMLVLPTESVPDSLLRRAGATTVDFVHGSAGSGWLPFRRPNCTVRCVWTQADAAALSDMGELLVAGMPQTVGRSGRPHSPARNVLIVTNYVHRDSRIGQSFPFLPFQDELLRVVPVIRARYGDRFQLRWRPHPADNEECVQHTLRNCPGAELSRGRQLAEDAAWSDIVISSLSSATVELLLAEVPMFVHVMPSLSDTPDAHCFAADRKFTYAREFDAGFQRCVELLDAGSPDAFVADRQARRAFFGEAERPSGLDDWLRTRVKAQAG